MSRTSRAPTSTTIGTPKRSPASRATWTKRSAKLPQLRQCDPVGLPVPRFFRLDDVVRGGAQHRHPERLSCVRSGSQLIEGRKLPSDPLRRPRDDVDVTVTRPPRRHLVLGERPGVQRFDRLGDARHAKASVRSPLGVCQRIEIVRLPAGHDVDVEGCSPKPQAWTQRCVDQFEDLIVILYIAP